MDPLIYATLATHTGRIRKRRAGAPPAEDWWSSRVALPWSALPDAPVIPDGGSGDGDGATPRERLAGALRRAADRIDAGRRPVANEPC